MKKRRFLTPLQCPSTPWKSRFVTVLAVVCVASLLTACGGGAGSETSQVSIKASPDSSSPAFDPRQSANAVPDANLTQRSLATAEQQAQAAEAADTNGEAAAALDKLQAGQIAPKSAYLSGEIARKAAAVRIAAYRFYNGSTGAHFFTTSETERANVAANLSPPFNFEGAAFSVASAFSPGLSPVHRFYNTRSGVHFYTISEAERANVVATLPFYNYEGVAYHASQVAGAGFIPFYRFYVPSKGFHFYTASETEKNNIQATLSAVYKFEGVGYYVLSSEWRAEKLPHTGITAAQCYRAGNISLVACNQTLGEIFLGVPSSAQLLNPQQDGHRRNLNTMSYSEVAKAGGGVYTRAECVKDNVTGLVWEGKTDGSIIGLRSGANTYTNLGNNAATDTSGYVATVNASGICGFTDWRMPTRNELLNLVDYANTVGPPINNTWFPNTASVYYWSDEGLSTNSAQAWYVAWEAAGGWSYSQARSAVNAVRLVRGAAPTGPRYSYSSVAYGGDGVNNVVDDAWTGLQWRRCEEGRVWNGNACAGSATTFLHEDAMVHARQQAGWRLPNIKELSSLTDLSVSAAGVARVDGVAFPGAAVTYLWSSSPEVGNAYFAEVVYFVSGGVNENSRGNSSPVRLVRASQ